MSLFSFLRKNKQANASEVSGSYSRTEEQPSARRKKKGGAAPIDPVLPEKKRARRRLVGAIALVLAAVIGLPMILDSEPKPLASDIDIEIPSKDKPVPAPARQPAAPAAVEASSALDPKEEVIDPPSAPVQAANQHTETAPARADKAQEAVKPAETKSAADDKPAKKEAPVKAEAKPDPKPEPKPQPKLAEKPDESARALALLDGKSDPKSAAEQKSGKFVIQIAALASQAKVAELQAKLKDAGIKSYTQKVATDSGDRIRVRVGPFASKEEADKARAKIGKLGLNGTLVPA